MHCVLVSELLLHPMRWLASMQLESFEQRILLKVFADLWLGTGHIVTPMVEQNFKEVPGLREEWESESMLGRISKPEEFRGAATFLLSNASSYMTGSSLIIDGGHTAW